MNRPQVPYKSKGYIFKASGDNIITHFSHGIDAILTWFTNPITINRIDIYECDCGCINR